MTETHKVIRLSCQWLQELVGSRNSLVWCRRQIHLDGSHLEETSQSKQCNRPQATHVEDAPNVETLACFLKDADFIFRERRTMRNIFDICPRVYLSIWCNSSESTVETFFIGNPHTNLERHTVVTSHWRQLQSVTIHRSKGMK